MSGMAASTTSPDEANIREQLRVEVAAAPIAAVASAFLKLVAPADPVAPICHSNLGARVGPGRFELRQWHAQAPVFPTDHDEHLMRALVCRRYGNDLDFVAYQEW